MLPTFKKQSSYERLSSNDDKENRPIDFTLPYSPSSSSTSSCSWDRSWPSTPSFHLLRETYALTPKTYLNNRSDGSGWESPCSTGYGSDSIWSSPQSSAINFDIFKDSANSSSNSLLKPLPIPSPVDDAYSSRSTVYSSLSSSSFTASTSFADFGSDDFIGEFCCCFTATRRFRIHIMFLSDNLTPLLNDTHDEVRRDFENNGKTTEYIENEYFVPSVSSTPMAHRKPRYFHTNMHRQQTMELKQQTFVYPKPQTQVEFERPYPQMGRKFKPHKKSLGDVRNLRPFTRNKFNSFIFHSTVCSAKIMANQMTSVDRTEWKMLMGALCVPS